MLLISLLQLHKLMVYDPEESLSGDALQHFQVLWANNGDAISRQYTGTDALKVYLLDNCYCLDNEDCNKIHLHIFYLYACAPMHTHTHSPRNWLSGHPNTPQKYQLTQPRDAG